MVTGIMAHAMNMHATTVIETATDTMAVMSMGAAIGMTGATTKEAAGTIGVIVGGATETIAAHTITTGATGAEWPAG